jgi:hypothetical protein
MNSWRLNWPTRLPRLLSLGKHRPLCTSIVFETAELQSFRRPLGRSGHSLSSQELKITVQADDLAR